MADASHSELISTFKNITGVDEERAKFYLESAAWHLDMAISSFYEDGGDDDGDDDDDIVNIPSRMAQPVPQQSMPAQPRQEKSRFGTMSGMRAEEEDSDEEHQAFYAGGSEHGGGQQVLGPPKKKVSAEDLVKNMFQAAKEHGAEVVDDAGPSTQPTRLAAFRGTGYRLGDTEDTSATVMGRPVSTQRTQVDVVLKLWKSGFSVDGGELRDYQDPANKQFLDSIHRGEVPHELLRMARGGEVNLNMEDHRTEDYVKPKVTLKAFSGEGHMLGSPTPTVAQSTSATKLQTQQNETTAEQSVTIDSSQPVTNIQIRLTDGTRMVAKFNHSHTVSDIRTYIIGAHPEFATAEFVLMTTFPNKELSDETETLEQAKLLNAVLVQRMK